LALPGEQDGGACPPRGSEAQAVSKSPEPAQPVSHGERGSGSPMRAV